MIKLLDILNEENDIYKKGFELSPSVVEPDTGRISSDVKYLPKLERIIVALTNFKKDLKIYKLSSNQDISNLSNNIIISLTRTNKMINNLNKLLELNKEIDA